MKAAHVRVPAWSPGYSAFYFRSLGPCHPHERQDGLLAPSFSLHMEDRFLSLSPSCPLPVKSKCIRQFQGLLGVPVTMFWGGEQKIHMHTHGHFLMCTLLLKKKCCFKQKKNSKSTIIQKSTLS